MRALVCEKFGPPETLVLGDVPMPDPAPNEIRIRVKAAGVNFPDTLMLEGRYHVQAQPPFIPGSEVAGVVDAVGAQAGPWRVGDKVCAMTVKGGFADYVAVDATRAVRLPDTIDFATGSALLMTHGTAMHALRQRAVLQAGERLLVLGAGGGVGLAAVGLGKAMGAQVIAAASHPDKLALAAKHGAQHLIDYATTDLRSGLRDIGGVDVIFDPVGGDLSEQAFRAIAPEGRHLVIGFAAGSIPSLSLNLPLLKSAALVGVFWGAFTTRNPALHRANMNEVFAMLDDGRLMRPHLQSFALADGAQALRLLADRKAMGKCVLVME